MFINKHLDQQLQTKLLGGSQLWHSPDGSTSAEDLDLDLNIWALAMAAILKVWRQIRNPTHLKNIPATLRSDPIWNDGVLGLFEEVVQ